MNINKNENSLKNNLYDANKITSKKIKLFNLKFIHKIFDSVNISLLILIFILSFLSFNSQRKWTSIYENLTKTKANNNNLIDYISKTEEFYINEIESLNTFKKATPKDLIYLDKQITKNKGNDLNKKIKFIKDGLKDSKYQKGY
jgi:formyltetrahydrofolate synthetase